ncbi:cytochrome c [Sphingomonas sp. G124]|uniref:Cytochrome c n=1 Tax=Sphingomonas cremea TaxID=2904799 RepID=A0A9X1QJE4_9SPHN|nr:cytochrome c [Sphingomonas cremea]MCF2513644.1 cytochrome c [Sphingomonas cremea]
MKNFVILLAFAGLAACNRNGSEDGKAPVSATPAALSFEGADYKDDAAKIAHGKRLATILDCTGCHGENLQGKNVTADDPNYGDMNAPNVTLLLEKYSDADLDKLFRHGVPKDGREFWFMPVESFQFLSDDDYEALKAYIRSFKPAGTQLPPIKKGKGFYEDVERGFGDAQQQIARYRANLPSDMGKEHEWGRYLVETTCTACHNSQLQGYEGFTPNLDVAGAYSEAELTRLLTTGEGKVKKELGMMSDMARNHFSQLTSRERDAIVDYVLARAGRPQPAQAQ